MTSLLERIRSRDPIPEAKFDWLGTARGRRYGRHKGQEYAVDLQPSDPAAFTPGSGEMLVARKRAERLEDGAELVTVVTMRAWPVQPGTFDKLSKSRRGRPAEKPMRAWDRLASLELMQRVRPALPAETLDAFGNRSARHEHHVTPLQAQLRDLLRPTGERVAIEPLAVVRDEAAADLDDQSSGVLEDRTRHRCGAHGGLTSGGRTHPRALRARRCRQRRRRV